MVVQPLGDCAYAVTLEGADSSRAAALAEALRRERVVELIMLMTVAIAERARQLELRRSPELDHDAFTANLTDVLVGILEAPVTSPATAPANAG